MTSLCCSLVKRLLYLSIYPAAQCGPSIFDTIGYTFNAYTDDGRILCVYTFMLLNLLCIKKLLKILLQFKIIVNDHFRISDKNVSLAEGYCLEKAFKAWSSLRKKPGPGCSKLTTSLVNVSLKFQTLISQIRQYFLFKKCEKLFSQFNQKFLCFWL